MRGGAPGRRARHRRRVDGRRRRRGGRGQGDALPTLRRPLDAAARAHRGARARLPGRADPRRRRRSGPARRRRSGCAPTAPGSSSCSSATRASCSPATKATGVATAHPVYAFYRTHVGFLLRQILGDDDAGPSTSWTRCSRRSLRSSSSTSARSRGMSLEEMTTAGRRWPTRSSRRRPRRRAPRAEVGDPADVPRTRPCVDSRHGGSGLIGREPSVYGLRKPSPMRSQGAARSCCWPARPGSARPAWPRRSRRRAMRWRCAARRARRRRCPTARCWARCAATARRARRAGLVRPAPGASRAAAARARAARSPRATARRCSSRCAARWRRSPPAPRR